MTRKEAKEIAKALVSDALFSLLKGDWNYGGGKLGDPGHAHRVNYDEQETALISEELEKLVVRCSKALTPPKRKCRYCSASGYVRTPGTTLTKCPKCKGRGR